MYLPLLGQRAEEKMIVIHKIEMPKAIVKYAVCVVDMGDDYIHIWTVMSPRKPNPLRW